MEDLVQDYIKMKIAVRSKLEGLKYFKALRSMEFAMQYHVKTRKNGDHEFSHQVSQVALALTLLEHFEHPEDLICIIFLHDICEDYHVPFDTIRDLFGQRVRNGVFLMSKEYKEAGKTIEVDNDVYYERLANDPIASIAKGFDRVHNLMTMLGGFSQSKIKEYIEETLEKTVPMLKIARRKFPEQNGAYENIKFIMTNQVQLYNALLKK